MKLRKYKVGKLPACETSESWGSLLQSFNIFLYKGFRADAAICVEIFRCFLQTNFKLFYKGIQLWYNKVKLNILYSKLWQQTNDNFCVYSFEYTLYLKYILFLIISTKILLFITTVYYFSNNSRIVQSVVFQEEKVQMTNKKYFSPYTYAGLKDN